MLQSLRSRKTHFPSLPFFISYKYGPWPTILQAKASKGFDVTFEILSASFSRNKTCLILVSVSPQHCVHLEHLNRMFFGYLNSAFCDGIKEVSSEGCVKTVCFQELGFTLEHVCSVSSGSPYLVSPHKH
jgi:hypothetical protein